MPQPVTYNPGTPVSGSIQENNISYVVDGQNRDYRGGFGGLSWMSELPAANNVVFIGNSTTIGKGPSGKPLFYPSFNNSAANIIYAVNTLPGSPRNFTTTGSAYNWAATNNFFINNSDNPIPRIDADGLVLYVDANQPTSYPQINNTWYDLSGQNNVTNLLNGPAWNSNGWIVFDSTDDYADTSVNTNTLFSSNDPFSVLITIKPTETINANSGLVTNQKYQSEGSPGGFGLVTYNANQVAINLTKNDGTGTVSYEALAPTTLTINSWQNITYTYDPVAGTVTGYKNGTLANSSTSAAYKWTPEARVSWIGRNWQGGWSNDFFSSEISNVSIYRKTLSQSEIKQNYFQSNIVQDGLVFMVDANNLVSYPKSGTAWYTLTGSAGTAVLTNGPSFSPNNGGSIVFDGVDDYVNTTYSSAYDFSNANFSMEAWFYANPVAYGTYEVICNRATYGSNERSYELYIAYDAANPYIWFGTYNSGWTYVNNPSLTNIQFNQWNHVVATSDGLGNGKVYINGELRQTNSSFNTAITTTTVPIQIGAYVGGAVGGWFNGKIPTVKLYSRALSADEVLQNYQATQDKFLGQNIVTNGLLLNLDAANKDSYPGIGTTWNNTVSNSYNATLYNGPIFNPSTNTISLDGVDDYVASSVNSALSNTATVVMLCYGTPSATDRMYCSFGYYDVYYYGGTSNDRRLVFNTGNGDGYGCAGISDATISGLNMYTFVFRTDVSYTNNQIWINTTQQSLSQQFGTEFAGNKNFTTGNFQIGSWAGGGYYPNIGVISTLVYNRQLSSSEITQNYNAFRAKFSL
jgi:hypothetical protein